MAAKSLGCAWRPFWSPAIQRRGFRRPTNSSGTHSAPTLRRRLGCNVLVVGDVMTDEHWTGATDRISPEAPVPVVRVQKIEERPGGAANVAANVRAMGVNCTLLGECARPRIRKLRVMSRHQQLIRLDFEE